RPAPPSTLFPYTTLFRSRDRLQALGRADQPTPEHDRPVPQAPFTLHVQQLSLRWPGALSGPSDLDLQLYSGQTLLVIGPSGGGKDRKSTRLNSSHVKISY